MAENSDHQVLETSGIAFDPTNQHLDLSKDEKRRTTALLLAIQAYDKLIIREAAYLREAADMARRDEGPKIHPATIDAMIEAAIRFDQFIAGGPGSSDLVVPMRDDADPPTRPHSGGVEQ